MIRMFSPPGMTWGIRLSVVVVAVDELGAGISLIVSFVLSFFSVGRESGCLGTHTHKHTHTSDGHALNLCRRVFWWNCWEWSCSVEAGEETEEVEKNELWECRNKIPVIPAVAKEHRLHDVTELLGINCVDGWRPRWWRVDDLDRM